MAPRFRHPLPAAPPQITLTIADVNKIIQNSTSRRPARTAGGGGGDTQPVSGGWPCRYTDCPMAVNERMNYSFRSRCKGCDRTKASAMSPPARLAVPPPEPTHRPPARARAVPGMTPVARKPRARAAAPQVASAQETPK